MKNYKKIGWIEEILSPPDKKFSERLCHSGSVCLLIGCMSLPSAKENTIMDHPRQEIAVTPILKKEKF
ncbi:hypothetical protein [Chryseobacterium sp. ON_d1]|uniref:hypothetical protein n=1 Tax=Chryseobacterium sp. ON_d1 TaxID=2583211 RepID=UPI00115BF52C|nr:hypothetical protein [Chryseobacterium sp. ON_d1]GEJ45816.1 hypothetical protein CRS_24240 [Chryseobacterium sp. ON_d1]